MKEVLQSWWVFLLVSVALVGPGALVVGSVWAVPRWRLEYGAASVWVVLLVWRYGISPWSRFGPPPALEEAPPAPEKPAQDAEESGKKEGAPPGPKE